MSSYVIVFSDAAGNISSSIRAGVYRQSVSIFTPVYRITPIDTTLTNNYYTINNRVDNLTGIYVDNSDNYYYRTSPLSMRPITSITI